MTAILIPFPDRSSVDYWGGCPLCGRDDGFLDDVQDHWFVCHKHRRKWYVGSNLFSGWRGETTLDWERNRTVLAGYREVEPLTEPASVLGYHPAEIADLLDEIAAERRSLDSDAWPA